jgi:hypothetical protein
VDKSGALQDYAYEDFTLWELYHERIVQVQWGSISRLLDGLIFEDQRMAGHFLGLRQV